MPNLVVDEYNDFRFSSNIQVFPSFSRIYAFRNSLFMVRILLIFTTVFIFVECFKDYLIEGRHDTLRVLKRMIREKNHHHRYFSLYFYKKKRIIYRPLDRRRITWKFSKDFEKPLKWRHRKRRHINRAVIESGWTFIYYLQIES